MGKKMLILSLISFFTISVAFANNIKEIPKEALQSIVPFKLEPLATLEINCKKILIGGLSSKIPRNIVVVDKIKDKNLLCIYSYWAHPLGRGLRRSVAVDLGIGEVCNLRLIDVSPRSGNDIEVVTEIGDGKYKVFLIRGPTGRIYKSYILSGPNSQNLGRDGRENQVLLCEDLNNDKQIDFVYSYIPPKILKKEEGEEVISSYLVIDTHKGRKCINLWKSPGRNWNIRHIEAGDIDGDGVKELIIQTGAEEYNASVGVIDWDGKTFCIYGDQKLSGYYGFEWCLYDFNADGKQELITIGDSIDNEYWTRRLTTYEYWPRRLTSLDIFQWEGSEFKRILHKNVTTYRRGFYTDLTPIGILGVEKEQKTLIFASDFQSKRWHLAGMLNLLKLSRPTYTLNGMVNLSTPTETVCTWIMAAQRGDRDTLWILLDNSVSDKDKKDLIEEVLKIGKFIEDFQIPASHYSINPDGTGKATVKVEYMIVKDVPLEKHVDLPVEILLNRKEGKWKINISTFKRD